MHDSEKKYFITLTGAKKNVGDFLITDRAIKLFQHIAPEYEYIKLPHWESFKDLNYINKSEGIIILGGPGFQMNMYPGVYKLTEDLMKIKVPIYTLGVGWKGIPGDQTTEKLYRFTKSGRSLLEFMERTKAGMSCRDHQTYRVLSNNGYKNLTMTGCPVWYDLPSLGNKFKTPTNFKRIIYTPAQDKRFSNQSIEVMNYLKGKFKDSEIIVSFHRGVGEVDIYSTELDAQNTKKIAAYAREIGLTVLDLAYDLKKLNAFYDNSELHIGYRVHAHLYFLSKRRPSILLHEDGRGNGVTETLLSPGIDAYKSSKFSSKLFNVFNKNTILAKVYSKIGVILNDNIIGELDNELEVLKTTEFGVFHKVTQLIDENYYIMKQYIENIILKKED